jgi:YD repeat-containing protein
MAHMTCPRCGSLLMSTGRCAYCNESSPVARSASADSTPSRKKTIRRIVIVAHLIFIFGALIFGRSRLINRQRHLQPVGRSLHHSGPVARVDQLKGTGRIYLVQMGDHKDPYSLDDFANWLHGKYALQVKVLPPVKIDKSAWNAKRKQYEAQSLYAQMKQHFPDLASDPDAYLIGFTDADMYSIHQYWKSSFTQRDSERAAVISSDGMQDTPLERLILFASHASPDEDFHARLRRILLKDVALLYWHLPLSDDPTSLLHNTLDPDLPTEDIFESDINPALSPEGETESEPCVFFAYSPRQGIKPLPGRLIRPCGDTLRPEDDTTIEKFEVVLRLGILIDLHTDFNLPDHIPIQFERATRDGWSKQNPFGISGTDNYDEFLSSPDNITISVVAADSSRRELVRFPREVSNLSLVSYTDKNSPGFYELRWRPAPFEHYDLRRFDGTVKAYLPCLGPSLMCYLTGYRNPNGEELKFERGEHRRLMRLTSPNQSSIRLEYTASGSISQITDSTGRVVRYGYDQKNRLIRVAYPSGETCHYQYDDAQHLLAFSISHGENAKPTTLVRNEYANGLLVKQTIADGSVYAYEYTMSGDHTIRGVTVHGADGRIFKLDITQGRTIVHEQPDR